MTPKRLCRLFPKRLCRRFLKRLCHLFHFWRHFFRRTFLWDKKNSVGLEFLSSASCCISHTMLYNTHGMRGIHTCSIHGFAFLKYQVGKTEFFYRVYSLFWFSYGFYFARRYVTDLRRKECVRKPLGGVIAAFTSKIGLSYVKFRLLIVFSEYYIFLTELPLFCNPIQSFELIPIAAFLFAIIRTLFILQTYQSYFVLITKKSSKLGLNIQIMCIWSFYFKNLQ